MFLETYGGPVIRALTVGSRALFDDAPVVVESLQTGGLYRTARVDPPHARDPRTLLALQLEGKPLTLDHGFPVRLISPNRPGVLQTKWITLVRPA